MKKLADKEKKTFSLSKKTVDELQKESDSRGLAKSAIVQIALEDYFEKRKKMSV